MGNSHCLGVVHHEEGDGPGAACSFGAKVFVFSGLASPASRAAAAEPSTRNGTKY